MRKAASEGKPVKSGTTMDWDRVIEELACAPPRRLRTFIKRLQKKRTELILRRGYRALARSRFDDLPVESEWVAVENEALNLIEEEIDAYSKGRRVRRKS